MNRWCPLLLVLAAGAACGQPYSEFTASTGVWTLGNELFEASFEHGSEGRFRFLSLQDKRSGRVWAPPAGEPSSLVLLTVSGQEVDANTRYRLAGQRREPAPKGGLRQVIELAAESPACAVRVELEVYPGQPFLRYRFAYRNTASSAVTVTNADLMNWRFSSEGGPLRGLLVGQWSWGGERANFEPHEIDFSTLTAPVEAFTGAYGNHSTWGALRDAKDHGLVFGWEFDGRARAHAEVNRSTGVLWIDCLIQRLNRPLSQGQEMIVPAAFVGLYTGDWDEAGYRTQRFAEAVLAPAAPDARFPYVMYDSWAYQWDINEEVLRDGARRAAALGVEVFTVDFGWARVTGDWQPDPEKFPNGLRPLADYVKSLGMKFGLHLPYAEAAPESRVMREHPDWAVVNEGRRGYFGAEGLCLAHRPAREWVIAEIIRVVKENGVDWLLQDGENMVKRCEATSHTHHPLDSNLSNAEALNEALTAVRGELPDLLWENCEDGGNMQTFNMIRNYHTSIVNDNSDLLTTRRSVYGATYPFPPRYTDRYMETTPWGTYYTRSHFFGGPLILMQKVTEWPEWMLELMKREVALYKAVRGHVRDGKVFHITPPPDDTFHDALQSHDIARDRSLIFVYRPEGTAEQTVVRPRGLRPEGLYAVRFQDDERRYTAPGRVLMEQGVTVNFELDPSAEVVFLDGLGGP